MSERPFDDRDAVGKPPSAPPTTIAGRQCSACGYSLEGLPEAGACPECGTSYTLEDTIPLRPPPGARRLLLRR